MEAYHSGQLLQYIQQRFTVSESSSVNYPYVAVTVDSLLSAVHFPENTSPEWIAHKSLAVNLSDLASMGAKPLSISLGLVLPQWNKVWVKQFISGFDQLQSRYNFQFTSCDVKPGPLSITIQAYGGLKNKNGLLRSSAQPGDLIFVTNTIGDAACAWSYVSSDHPIPEAHKDFLEQRFNLPQPQVEVGLCLNGLANAAIDISDGLAADLQHILEASEVGAILDIESMPSSHALQSLTTSDQRYNYQLSGGDDYELCFTVSSDKRNEMQNRLSKLGVNVTEVGKVTSGSELCYQQNGHLIKLDVGGYDHFK